MHTPAVKTFFALMLFSLALLTQGCGEDIDRTAIPGEPVNPQLSFVLEASETPGGSSISRATPEGEYHSGFAIEKYINFEDGDLRFLFFDSNNVLQCTFVPYDIQALPGDSANHSKRYRVVGGLPEVFDVNSGFDTKLMILANWETRLGSHNAYPAFIPGQTTMADIWEAGVFDFGAEDIMVSEDKPIPFYGVTNLMHISAGDFTHNMGTHSESMASLGTVHLLRSLAKIEIVLDKQKSFKTGSTEPWQLDDVWLTAYASKAYPAPTNVSCEDDYVKGQYDLDYTATPHVPENAVRTSGDIHFMKVADDNEATRYVAYVPEFDNKTGSVKSRIRLKFANSVLPYNEVLFCKYTDGAADTQQRLDILRNNWYRFTVTKTDEHINLNVELDMQPYANVELRPEYGFERDSEGNIVVKNDQGQIIRIVKTDGEALNVKNDTTIGGVEHANAVLNKENKLLMANCPNGDQLIPTYKDTQTLDTLSSMERYTPYNSKNLDSGYFLSEDVLYWKYECMHLDDKEQDNSHIHRYQWLEEKQHDFYDRNGVLIERYLYGTKNDYEKNPTSSNNVKRVVWNEVGSGNVIMYIYYADVNGKKYCKVTLTRNADGTIEEEYDEIK